MYRTTTRSLLAAATIAMLLCNGCGSDGAGTDAAAPDATAVAAPTATDTTDSADTTEGAGTTDDSGVAAGCAEWIAADDAVNALMVGGQGDVDSVNTALDDAVAATEGETSSLISDLEDAAQAAFADPESEPSEELLALYGDAVTWAADSCGVPSYDVTAVDYKYQGLPTEMDAGYTVVNLQNTGKEFHEMFVVRLNDGTTESIDEIFALPEEEAFSKFTPINAAFAPPGQTSTSSFDLGEPGTYVFFCAMPVGSVGGAEGDGPPHFTQGMVQEVTVS